MTPESIARLDEISQHPTIRRGILAIKIPLGPHYDSEITHDIQSFAHYRASKLHDRINYWQFKLHHPSLNKPMPTEVFQNAIDLTIPIAESWENVAQHGVDEDCSEHVSSKSPSITPNPPNSIDSDSRDCSVSSFNTRQINAFPRY